MAPVQPHSVVGERVGGVGFPLRGSGDYRWGSVSGQPGEEDEDQHTDQEPNQNRQAEGQDQTLCGKEQETAVEFQYYHTSD